MARLAAPQKQEPQVAAGAKAAPVRRRVLGLDQRKRRANVWADVTQSATLQRALEVSKPDDEQEREADEVADEVMRKEDTGAAPGTGDDAPGRPPSGIWTHHAEPDELQREEDESQDEDEKEDSTEASEVQRAPESPSVDDEER